MYFNLISSFLAVTHSVIPLKYKFILNHHDYFCGSYNIENSNYPYFSIHILTIDFRTIKYTVKSCVMFKTLICIHIVKKR